MLRCCPKYTTKNRYGTACPQAHQRQHLVCAVPLFFRRARIPGDGSPSPVLGTSPRFPRMCDISYTWTSFGVYRNARGWGRVAGSKLWLVVKRKLVGTGLPSCSVMGLLGCEDHAQWHDVILTPPPSSSSPARCKPPLSRTGLV